MFSDITANDENYMKSKITLELKSTPGNPRNSEGSFVTLKDGRILYAYTGFYGESWHDNGSARIVSRYSDDQGESWTDRDALILDSKEGVQNIMEVSLLRLNDNRIAMLYLRKNSLCDLHPMIRFSSDEAQTWSEPVRIIKYDGSFVVNNDRMIQTANSRIIIPAAFHPLRTPTDNSFSPAIDVFFYSDDHGASWQRSPSWLLPPQKSKTGLQEPGIIELSENNLMSYSRTDYGAQFTSFSYDNGETWNIAERNPNFLSPLSPMSMKRNPYTNEIIAVWNDHDWTRWKHLDMPKDASWNRTPLVMAFSKDNGKFWERHTLIESKPDYGYCYTAIHFVPNGILLAYCCGGGNETAVLQDSVIRKISY